MTNSADDPKALVRSLEPEKPGEASFHHPAPSALEAEGLCRRFGETQALAGISFSVRKGEFFSILGPSGCGKTTLLRVIAGLDHPDAGWLRIGGSDAGLVPAHKRPVNTVFQSYALFPHMRVRENIGFGLRMRKVPGKEAAARVERVMALVRIAELADRWPAQLSGGEKQRVALARALVNEPEVLLLDEPLGALDFKLRKELQVELHRLQRRLGITFIHVTHDQDEALSMSDRIAVMNAGRIEQLDTAEQLYERPRTRFVAQFLGSCNLLCGKLESISAGHAIVTTALGQLRARLDTGAAHSARSAGASMSLAIRPEKIRLLAAGTPGGNRVEAQVEELVYSGAETQYRLRAGGAQLIAVCLNAGADQRAFAPGAAVTCEFPESALVEVQDP